MNDPMEWDFGVPASQVDLEKIWNECKEMSIAERALYVATLRNHAPVVHGLYEQYCTKKLDGIYDRQTNS